jgi:hypothetical protein
MSGLIEPSTRLFGAEMDLFASLPVVLGLFKGRSRSGEGCRALSRPGCGEGRG